MAEIISGREFQPFYQKVLKFTAISSTFAHLLSFLLAHANSISEEKVDYCQAFRDRLLRGLRFTLVRTAAPPILAIAPVRKDAE